MNEKELIAKVLEKIEVNPGTVYTLDGKLYVKLEVEVPGDLASSIIEDMEKQERIKELRLKIANAHRRLEFNGFLSNGVFNSLLVDTANRDLKRYEKELKELLDEDSK